MEFSYISVVVDSHGYTHVAAAQDAEVEQGIWYLTNATGSWTSTEVAPVTGSYDTAYTRPMLALDTNDSLWIAFTRESCPPDRCTSMDIAYVTNASGHWSDPIPVDIGQHDLILESVAVRDGVVHVAYTRHCFLGWNNELGECANTSYFAPLYYAANDGGEWTSRLVLKRGGAALLSFDEAGEAGLLISPMVNPPLGVSAAFERSDFSVEQVWDVSYNHPAGAQPLWLGEDADGTPGAIWDCWCEGADDTLYYATRTDGSWNEPTKILERGKSTALFRDTSGLMQLVGAESVADEAAKYIYTENSGGTMESRSLLLTGAMADSGTSGAPGSIGLGVDNAGRPHIVYVNYGKFPPTDLSLWYVEGPAPRP